MAVSYKKWNDPDTKQLACILRKLDGETEYYSSIPLCNDNMDYQEYLAWVAAGNEADPAD